MNDRPAWTCDWKPDDLNLGPECPYCEGDMCARFDGLGCTHDRIERHGYPAYVGCQTCIDIMAAAINDAQVDPDELRLGRDLRPVAARIVERLTPKGGPSADRPYFDSLVCGVAVCNWSGPRSEFDSHPHRSW